MSGDIDDFRALLAKVGNGETLGIDEAERAFDIMTSGDATPAQMGAFLMGLKVRGETAQELAGGARALRAKVHKVRAPAGAIDIVGTGGDHHGTYNVSSCSALVVAGAGVPVAKHGNRAFTSKSGAADVLAALGIGLELPIEKLEQALVEANVCFLMAPRHHSAMRNVAGPRSRAGAQPHHLQPAGPDVEPGPGQAPARGRIRPALASPRGRGAGRTRAGTRPGRARPGRHGRDHHHDQRAGPPRSRTARCARSRSRPKRSA